MIPLRTTDVTDHRGLPRAVEAALDGSAPLALGFDPGAADRVPEGTAVVIATSGSSGVPKRVVLSAAALRASAEATAARIGAGQWLLALPAGYVAGLQVLVRSLLAGTRPVALRGRFAVGSFLDAAAELDREPALTSLVPAQLATLVEAADDARVRDALGRFDAILVGGQALPPSLRDRAADLGVRLVRTYGSSETSGGCVYERTPLDVVRVRAVDGELQIAGPTLAAGYLGDEVQTADRFIWDAGVRWYRTGDLGEVRDGIVRVVGRVDNVIVSGGVNVSLDRVEAVVRGLAGFGGAVVVGVDDDRWGESPGVVVPRGELPGADLPAEAPAGGEHLGALREAVGTVLGVAARPSIVLPVEEVPLLASGKPDRTAIRRILHEAAHGSGPRSGI
ncbi:MULTISPECIES: AMP-binding protein [Bacteria]|uniref:AMP-binding protein n=1 Tax=Bacteria TaxID=2 RepID=UPI003C7C2DAB